MRTENIHWDRNSVMEDRERAFGCQGELMGTGRINQEGREIRKL